MPSGRREALIVPPRGVQVRPGAVGGIITPRSLVQHGDGQDEEMGWGRRSQRGRKLRSRFVNEQEERRREGRVRGNMEGALLEGGGGQETGVSGLRRRTRLKSEDGGGAQGWTGGSYSLSFLSGRFRGLKNPQSKKRNLRRIKSLNHIFIRRRAAMLPQVYFTWMR